MTELEPGGYHTQRQLSQVPCCECMQGTSKAGVLQGFLELVFIFPFVVVSLSPITVLFLAFICCCIFLSLLSQIGKLQISPDLMSRGDMNF